MKQDNHLIKGFYLNIIILQLIFLSFAAVFHKLEPIIIGGASLFLIIIPYVLMFFVFLNNLGKISTREVQLLIVIILLAFLIMFIRTILYDEILSKSVSSVYVIFIPTMFLILKNTYIPLSKYSLIRRVILIVIGFNFLNSLLYLMGLEFFETKFEDSDKYIAFSRFSGLFGSPNISSNIVLLMTILYVLTAEKLKESSALIMSIIFFITVLPNLSRGPIFIYIIFLIIYVIKVLKIKFNFVNVSFLILSLLGVLFFLSYFLENSEVDNVYNSFLNRTEEELDGKYGRMDRFYLAIKLIFEDFNAMLIGIQSSKQTVSEVFSISDNSLTLVLSNFGIPFTVLFVYFITKNINFYKIVKSKKQVFTQAVVMMGVFNNAVLWTAWPFFVILGYKLLSIEEKLNQEKINRNINYIT